MKDTILDNVKALPPLSKTISEINKVYADENASINDMARVVEKDPMIVANLLKAANSPLYGFSKDITNAAQAVSIFGMSMTRSIAIGNSVRKLLNVDMQPYGITPEKFAEISSWQATLMYNWYKKIDRKKADKLYLSAFLQETGKILIASYILENDEAYSFKSEVENSNNLAMVEKSYADMTSAHVTAVIFKHWKFDQEFIDMIRYSDNPAKAPDEIKEFATALRIVKTIIPVNKPMSEMAINFGLKMAADAGYDHEILEDAVDDMLDIIEGN